MILGIDGTNLRSGGGVTHLIELLRAVCPSDYGFDLVIVWSGQPTLDLIEDRPWLEKRSPTELNSGLFRRLLWQRYRLSREAAEARCNVLFVPGGSYAGQFHPVVNMCRNMLPFEWVELRRYGLTFFAIKLLLLRLTQLRTFRNTDGLIFLSKYAQMVVLKATGQLRGRTCLIPHGLNQRFKKAPKQQRPISHYSHKNPFRILYVSSIDNYKHQWVAVEAVNILRNNGWPIVLDLIGPAYKPALLRLNKVVDRLDTDRSWVNYYGVIPFAQLCRFYKIADLGLFASSCENLPNVLIEKMGAGLPIACSNRGPMMEVLGSNGVYFNPEDPNDIASALSQLIASPDLRSRIASGSCKSSEEYSWQYCSSRTFSFLMSIAGENFDKTVFTK